MKKNKLIQKSLVFLIPAALICSFSNAQNDAKQNSSTTAIQSKASPSLKAKYEANGLQWNENAKVNSTTTRTCFKDKNAKVAPNKVSKNLLSRLPKERQEYVRNHPEKYIIVN